MRIEEWQAKELYINKTQLEKALGISLSELPTKKFDHQEPLNDYLLPYASMPYFDENDAIALLQGFNPNDYRCMNNKPNFYPIHTALLGAIKKGELGNSTYDFAYGDFEALKIEHRCLEQWAKHYGYKWELPPYQPLNIEIEKSTDNKELLQQLTAKDEEIARLKTEIENLKQSQQYQIVDYEQRSIYGHTTESIKAIFDVINRFWRNADLSQPDTIENAENIEEWIAQNFNVSKTIRQSIQKITRPEQARYIGRKS